METQKSGGSTTTNLGSIDIPASLTGGVDVNGGESKTGDDGGGGTTNKGKVESGDAIKPEDKVEKPVDDKALLRAEENAHLAALETVGLVMGDKYTDKERADFFLEHPELANVANRSKRYKESYRDLVKRKDEGKLEPEKPEAKANEKPTEKKETNKDEFVDIDEDEFVGKVVSKLQEDNVRISRKKSARDFAVGQGLNENDFQTLHDVAEAIYKSNSDVEYTTALRSAMVSIGKEVTSQPLKMPTSETQFGQTKTEDPEVEISRIMELTRVDKDVATKIYNNGKKVTGDITGEGITIPTDF